MVKLQIRKFSLNELKENPSILIIGKRGSGKNFLVRNILNTIPNVPTTVISPTECDNPFYFEIPNVKKIHYIYQSKIIEDLLLDQKLALIKPQTTIIIENNNVELTYEQINPLLSIMNNLVGSVLATRKLDFSDVINMKNMIDTLYNQKLNVIIKKELSHIHNFIGSLLNKNDVNLNDLNSVKNMIHDVEQLKLNIIPEQRSKNNNEIKDIINVNFDYDDDDDDSFSLKNNKGSNLIQNIINQKHAIVLDDCLSIKGTWHKDPLFSQLLLNARRRNISCMITMQYPLGLKPEFRSNFDYIFLFADDYISNLKRIYEHYCGFFRDFNSFSKVYKQLTTGYDCVVIINKPCSNIFDKIAFYNSCSFEKVTIELNLD